MKELLFLGILFFVGLLCKAQRVYFIYLQSENATPFYVKMGDKIYSSSTAGYLILSNLRDSVYSLSVGLAGKQQTEPKFKVAIASGDRGFLIKELDQKLSLFDFHSMEVITPIASVDLKNEDFVTRTDNFTRTLSQVANDPSLLQETIKKEPVKPIIKDKPVVIEEKPARIESKDTVISATVSTFTENEKKDTIALIPNMQKADNLSTPAQAVVEEQDSTKAELVQETSTTKEEKKDTSERAVTKVEASSTTQPVVSVQEYKRSTVVRRSESSTSEGFGLTYLDYTAEGTDTIRLLIPNPKVPFKSAAIPKVESGSSVKAVEDQSTAPTVLDTTMNKEVVITCKEKASDGDFRRLRQDMAAQESDTEMIQKAKDAFQSRCFTTEQLKNLSTLFLTAEGKYLFFESSVQHITDKSNIEILQAELKDDYYSNKFKALIAK